MSGYELEHRVLEELPKVSDQLPQGWEDDITETLIAQLKQSDDIVRDMTDLFIDRPYVYARVLNRLEGIVGPQKVKALNSQVRKKAATMSRKPAGGGKEQTNSRVPVGFHSQKTQTGDGNTLMRYTINVPQIGLNKTLELKKNGTKGSVSLDWDLPYLTCTKGEVSIEREDLKQIVVSADLKAPYMEAPNLTFKLTKGSKGTYVPSGEFTTTVQIPGIDDLHAKFSFSKAEGRDAKLVGQFDQTSHPTLFESSIETTVSGTVTLGEETQFDGVLKVTNKSQSGAAAKEIGDKKSGGKEAGAEKVAGKGKVPGGKDVQAKVPGKGQSHGKPNQADKKEEESAVAGPMRYSGTVNLKTVGGDLSGITGNLSVSNLGFLASPKDAVELRVAYDGEEFSAKLGKAVRFADRKVGGTEESPTTVSLSVNEASYSSKELLCADCTATAKIGSVLSASGNARISNNEFESGKLTVKAPNFALPTENSLVKGSLTGEVSFDANGFVDANVTGPVNLSIGGMTCPLKLDEMRVDAKGVFTGKISLSKPWKMGCVSIDAFSAGITSNGVDKVNGRISFNHPNLKSGKGGIAISGRGNKLNARGGLILSRDGKTEFAKCDAACEIGPDGFKAKGDFVLSQEYDLSDKFRVHKGAKASLAMENDVIKPIGFSGKYSYGDKGAGDGQEPQETPEEKGQLHTTGKVGFNGEFIRCTYDLDTGNLNGSATVQFTEDVGIQKGDNYIKLLSSQRRTKSALMAKITDSSITSVTGNLAFESSVKFGNMAKPLVNEGYLKNFTYDVEGETFTGVAEVGLNESYKVRDDLTFLGNNQTKIKLHFEKNELTNIGFDADAKLKIVNSIFDKGQAWFLGSFTNGNLNMDDGTFDVAEVKLSTADKETKMCLHEAKTELSLLKGSNISTSIAESKVTSLHGDVVYTGETTIFKNDKEPLEFKGNMNFDIADLQSEDSDIKGNVHIETTKNFKLDEIKDVDEFILLPKSAFDVKVCREGLDKVGGKILIRYNNTDKENQILKNGYSLNLKGEKLEYDIQNSKFNGKVSVSPAKNIVMSFGKGDQHKATILSKGSNIHATLKDNALKEFAGKANFTGQFAAGTGGKGKIEIAKGTADFEMDVKTGALSKFDVSADTSCDFNVEKVQVTTQKKPCHAECHLDKDGLKSAEIDGGVHLIMPIPNRNNKLDLTVGTGKKGLEYVRETGITGSVGVSCDKETIFGDFKHKSMGENAQETVYEYGIGSEKKRTAAADFFADINNSVLEKVHGSAGLFLRQKGYKKGDDALNVTGKLTFDCNIQPDVKLNSASGEVKISRKTLFGEPETLVLGESTAKLHYQAEDNLGLSGKVNLFLNDKAGKSKGDYLKFTSEGEFDCLNTKSFTGKVSAAVIREKQLGKSIPTPDRGDLGIFLSPKVGPTGFSTNIVDNHIQEANGDIGLMTCLGKKPFFSGVVNGTYRAASEGNESRLDATGKITLLSDMDFPATGGAKFSLAKGSYGEAKVVNNEITEIDGKLTINIAPPGGTLNKKGGGKLSVTANGKINVKEAMIEKFTGQAKVSGNYELFNGLSLTSLSAQVNIIKNELQTIKGAASIRYQKDTFVISGGCDKFEWQKGKGEEEDGFDFSGHLDVTAMDGKLHGNAGVSYSTLSNKTATPVIDGKLSYQFNNWLGGSIGVKFDGTGWEHPILSGELNVRHAELIKGRQLLGFNPAPKKLVDLQLWAGPVPITVAGGIGLGVSLDLKPVVFDADFAIEDYHLGVDKGMPKFKTDLNLSSGLDLKAHVSPFVQAGVGIANVIEAGVKLRGVASLNASADLALNGILEGNENGLSGEVGLGFDIKGGVSLSVIPSVYAELLGMKANQDITEWKFDLGDLIKFSWGKRFKFGSNGTTTSESDEKVNLDPQTTVDTQAEGTEEVGSDCAPKGKAEKQEDGPELPDAESVAKDANKGKEAEGEKSGFARKMDQVQKIATAFGNIAEAVSFISELVMAAVTGNVAGVVVFLAIKIIKGELNIAKIPTKVKEIVEGIKALKEFVSENEDFIKSIMPEWLLKIMDFFKNIPTLPQLLDMVVNKVTEKVKALGSPMDRILQPLVDFVKGTSDKILEIYELFEKGGLGNIVKGIFKVAGIGFSGVMDLIDAIKNMWSIFKDVVKECVASGYIYVKYKTVDALIDYDYYYWKLEIPNLVKFSGEGAIKDAIAAKALCGILSKAGLKKQKIS